MWHLHGRKYIVNRHEAGGHVQPASLPKVNRPAADGHVHGRFAPESKPACGRWAYKRARRARK